jgi:hypothetical protein
VDEDVVANVLADQLHAQRDEIARRPDATRQVFTDHLMGEIDDMASRWTPRTSTRPARTR